MNQQFKIRYSSMRSAAAASLEQYEKYGRSQEVYYSGGYFYLTTSSAPFTSEVLARLQEAAK
jgi:hypothetical protein